MTGNQKTSASVYAKGHSNSPFLWARNAAIGTANALVLCIQQFRMILADFFFRSTDGKHRASIRVCYDGRIRDFYRGRGLAALLHFFHAFSRIPSVERGRFISDKSPRPRKYAACSLMPADDATRYLSMQE